MTKHLLTAMILGLCILAPANAAETGRLETSFDKVVPYANMETLGQRLLHGMSYRQLKQDSEESKIDLTKFSVDPRNERWQLFVPESPADDGKYAVLVWLPDESDFNIPREWEAALSRQHVILVVAKTANEDRDFVFERAALGLLGLNGVASNYPVDPSSLYVGGHGSGTAVAEALALGYGDIFSGSILVGSLETPGSDALPVPKPGVFERVAQRSQFHVVLPEDAPDSSLDEFRTGMKEKVCVDDIHATQMTGDLPDARTLGNALSNMTAEPRPSAAQCVLERRLAGKLALEEIQRLLDEDEAKEAIEMLLATHRSFGGVIDQQVFELSDYMQEEFRGTYLKAMENAQQSLRISDAQGLENIQNVLPPSQRANRGN